MFGLGLLPTLHISLTFRPATASIVTGDCPNLSINLGGAVNNKKKPKHCYGKLSLFYLYNSNIEIRGFVILIIWS